MSFLSQLQWRFATQSFDPSKPLKKKDLSDILRAIRMAPTSYGLQPFHVYVIRDKGLRDKLQQATAGQSQVTESGVLLVFCARTDVKLVIDESLRASARSNDKSVSSYKQFRSLIEKDLGRLRRPELLAWAGRQIYLALGFALAACAEKKIDSCAIEGFTPAEYKRMLGLPKHLTPMVLLAVGYRAQGPKRKKSRVNEESLFTLID